MITEFNTCFIIQSPRLFSYFNRGFIKGQAPGKLTGSSSLLFLLSFTRKTKNAQLKTPTDLLHKNLMKPLCVLMIKSCYMYLFSHTLWPSRKPYWKIFSKSFNTHVRKEEKSIHPFALLYWFSHIRKLKNGWPCLKSLSNALQTVNHWIRHVCLGTVVH